MSKKWKTIVASAVLAAAVAASGTVTYFNRSDHSQSAYAAPVWSSATTTESVKSYGSTYTVPDRTVTIGDTTYTANVVVIKPNGTTTTKKEITLDVSGEYTIVYTAVAEGKSYVDEVTFRVDDAAYTLTSTKSSAEYGHYEYASEGASGVMVRLAAGDSITFNTPIDVSGATKNDVLVEAYVTPDVKGVKDFSKLIFTFTDVENPDIYLRYTVRQSSEGDGYPISYSLAGGNGQAMTGWEESWGRLHIDNEWGAQFRHSFSLAYDEAWKSFDVGADINCISFSFDAASLQSYVRGLMIVDHDNPAYFNTLWRGFQSGKVKLTVSADMYSSSSANFCISKLKGVDLTADKYVDSEAPTISIEGNYTEMPAGKKSTEYAVPTATAYDSYTASDCEVYTSVWYNNALVRVTNGKFTPTYAGEYTIVYESSDKMGNVSREIRTVNVSETLDVPALTLTATTGADVTVGDLVTIPSYNVTSASGKANVVITAEINGEKIAITGNSFRPEKAGAYKVVYTATDYIGQVGTAEYTFTAVMGDKPVFVETPAVPKAFVEGCDYTLPSANAIDYRSGTPVSKVATISITDQSGKKSVEDGVVNVAVENNMDTVTVTYECEGAVLTYNVPVVKAMIEEDGSTKLHTENYFIREGIGSYEKTDKGFMITASEADGGFLFANKLVAENCSIVIGSVAANSNFSGLDITYTDAEDDTKAVTAHLIRKTGKADIILSGVTTGLDGSFAKGSTFTFNYTQGKMEVDSAKLDIATYDDGTAFNGFPSKKVYVSVKFVGATEGDQINVVSVNDHTMSTATRDLIKPKIVVLSDNYGGIKSIGSTVTLPAAMSGDVLDPNVSLTMRVTDGNGKIVKDINGVELNVKNADPSKEYTIQLSEYGKYTITYESKEKFNKRPNSATLSYTLNVIDEIVPEIKFSARFAETVKVGDTMVIPKFTVSDNLTAAENITILKYVLTPSGELVTIPDNSNAVKATQAGKYEFRIIAVDETGNVGMERVTVTVTAE